MGMGEIIRSNRLKKGFPQHSMAMYLGVTTSAVSKWERGKAMPDIALLGPIARLLNITLEELLSFSNELTDAQINQYIEELDHRLKKEPFVEVFQWAKNLVVTHPNSHRMILTIATLMESHGSMQGILEESIWEKTIESWYEQVLHSEEEGLRLAAWERLFYFHLRKANYDKAQEALNHFSRENPERKRKQGLLHAKTKRTEEAYRTYEELLFATYQTASVLLQDLSILALEENDLGKAHLFTNKQKDLAEVFDMGSYYQSSPGLELAVLEKDVPMTLATMKAMLEGVETMDHFTQSPLYAHMTFREISKEYMDEVRSNLEAHFRDEETFGFLKGN